MSACPYCRGVDFGGWHWPGWCFDFDGTERVMRAPMVGCRPWAVPADREARAQRYRAGLCVDCGQAPHAPARPRCWACHAAATTAEPALPRGRVAACASCGRPGSTPGHVLCGPCTRARRKP